VGSSSSGSAGRPTPSASFHSITTAAAQLICTRLPSRGLCPTVDSVADHRRKVLGVIERPSCQEPREALFPRLLTGMTLRGFGFSACTANPEGLPPSLVQQGLGRSHSTAPVLPGQDTRWVKCWVGVYQVDVANSRNFA
jgi:hypothetical protein